MGREIRRVPVGFDWPIDKTWWGFLRPQDLRSEKCDRCDGIGYSTIALEMYNKWYGYIDYYPISPGLKPFEATEQAIVDFAKRNVSKTYTGDAWIKKEYTDHELNREARRLTNLFNGMWMYHLNQEEIDVMWDYEYSGLKDLFKEKPDPFTYNRSAISAVFLTLYPDTIIKHYAKKENFDPYCEKCKGEGSFEAPGAKWWTETPVPEGPAYQLWETVSEGSPVSPSFETPEELAQWLSDNYDNKLYRLSYEKWLAFINGPGWAPSAVGGGPEGFISGVEFIANRELANKNVE